MKVARKAGLRTGDQPEIVQTGVLGDVIVNFIRGETPGQLAHSGTVFVGRDPVNIMREAEKAVAAIREILDMLSNEQTTGTLKGIMENIEALTGEENRALLRTSLENISALTSELRQDMESMRQVFTPEFGEDVRSIVANARAASGDLPELTREGTLILRETRTHLIQLAENLSKNAEHFNSILAAVDEILATTARGEGTVGRLVKDPAMYDSTVAMLDAVRDTVTAIKYHGPIWGSRIRAEEEAKAAEAARASMIWRR
jgi:ABC-type transporter Mla subunit MlaD